MTLLVKLENLALGLLALYGYYQIDASWMMFALLILVPDVTFAGYIAGYYGKRFRSGFIWHEE